YPWLSAEFETRREETPTTTRLHLRKNRQKRTIHQSEGKTGETKRRRKGAQKRTKAGQEKGNAFCKLFTRESSCNSQDRKEEEQQDDLKRRREEAKGNLFVVFTHPAMLVPNIHFRF